MAFNRLSTWFSNISLYESDDATSPNGALTAGRGSLCVRDSAGAAELFINTDDALTWAQFLTTAPSAALTITLPVNANALLIGSAADPDMLRWNTATGTLICGAAGGYNLLDNIPQRFGSAGTAVIFTPDGTNVVASGATLFLWHDSVFIVADPVDTTKRARFDAGAVTAGQTRVVALPNRNIDLAALDAGSMALGTSGSTAGAPLVVYNFAVPAGAGNTDIVVADQVRILDVIVRKVGAAGGASTTQVLNAGVAVTDAMDTNDANGVISRPATIDPAQVTVAAGATLRVTTVGANDNASLTTVVCVRI